MYIAYKSNGRAVTCSLSASIMNKLNLLLLVAAAITLVSTDDSVEYIVAGPTRGEDTPKSFYNSITHTLTDYLDNYEKEVDPILVPNQVVQYNQPILGKNRLNVSATALLRDIKVKGLSEPNLKDLLIYRTNKKNLIMDFTLTPWGPLEVTSEGGLSLLGYGSLIKYKGVMKNVSINVRLHVDPSFDSGGFSSHVTNILVSASLSEWKVKIVKMRSTINTDNFEAAALMTLNKAVKESLIHIVSESLVKANKYMSNDSRTLKKLAGLLSETD